MRYCWTTLHVRDMEKSIRFYSEVIGLEMVKEMNPSSDMKIVFLGKGETQIELIWERNSEASEIGKNISLGFETDSLDDTTQFLEDKNISIFAGPFRPNPFIKFLYVLDPNGVKIQFVENIQP